MRVKLCRKGHFNAAHRLLNKDWSEEQNREVYGKCYNPNYHGHNYEYIVSVTGLVNVQTGFVINITELKKKMKKYIDKVFDHKNLNLDIPEFKTLNPTVENIAILIWNKLRPHILHKLDLEITLYETKRNFVVVKGD